MAEMYEDLSPEERVNYVQAAARDLVALAVQLGVSLRIDRVPLRPLASGYARHVVEAWPARELAVDWAVADAAYDNHYHKIAAGVSRAAWRALWLKGQTPTQLRRARDAHPISDREWAAQPASMREGCTVRVHGVGEL